MIDKSKDTDPNRLKLAVMNDKICAPRGKEKVPKDCWYDEPNTWKHYFIEDCKANNSRFKGVFRIHKTRNHKALSHIRN